MPRGTELHGPGDGMWVLGEERLRALVELAACGRSTAAALEAAVRGLGRYESGIKRKRCGGGAASGHLRKTTPALGGHARPVILGLQPHRPAAVRAQLDPDPSRAPHP